MRPLIVALIPGQQRSLERVKRMRIEVSNQLVEVINEFGPTMFDDFDEVRPLFIAPQTVPYQHTRSGASSSLPQPPHRQAANRGSGGGRVQQVASTLRATFSYTLWSVSPHVRSSLCSLFVHTISDLARRAPLWLVSQCYSWHERLGRYSKPRY